MGINYYYIVDFFEFDDVVIILDNFYICEDVFIRWIELYDFDGYLYGNWCGDVVFIY